MADKSVFVVSFNRHEINLVIEAIEEYCEEILWLDRPVDCEILRNHVIPRLKGKK